MITCFDSLISRSFSFSLLLSLSPLSFLRILGIPRKKFGELKYFRRPRVRDLSVAASAGGEWYIRAAKDNAQDGSQEKKNGRGRR